MHDAVRSKMFSQMLKDKALPDGFRDKVDKMVDNMDEEKVDTGRCQICGTSPLFGNAWNGRERKFCTECLLPISESGAKVLWIF